MPIATAIYEQCYQYYSNMLACMKCTLVSDYKLKHSGNKKGITTSFWTWREEQKKTTVSQVDFSFRCCCCCVFCEFATDFYQRWKFGRQNLGFCVLSTYLRWIKFNELVHLAENESHLNTFQWYWSSFGTVSHLQLKLYTFFYVSWIRRKVKRREFQEKKTRNTLNERKIIVKYILY